MALKPPFLGGAWVVEFCPGVGFAGALEFEPFKGRVVVLLAATEREVGALCLTLALADRAVDV